MKTTHTTTPETASGAATPAQRDTKAARRHRWLGRMADLGFTHDEAETLRRIEMTLQKWAEGECGDGNDSASWSTERDEATGKPFRCVYPHTGRSYKIAIADKEAGALRRARAILARHPGLWMYHQGDCRGCMLYVGRAADLIAHNGDPLPLDSFYTRGVAVCAD